MRTARRADATGSVTLAAGPHAVDLRYAWQSGRATLEWYWTPPGGAAALVPPAVLRPAVRSWPRGSVPDPPGAEAVNVAPAPPPAAVATPDAVLAGDAGLKEPRGVAVDAQGNLYVGDSGNFRVVRLSPDGQVLGSWGTQTDAAAPGRFSLLADLATGPDGHVVTLDAGTGDVQIFDAMGRLLHEVSHISSHASGIAVAPDGRIWVADTGDSRLVRLTADGAPDGTFTGAPADDPARFEQPIDVTFAPDGTPYVVDLRGRIMRLDTQGTITAQWPVDWGGARGGSHLAYWQNQVVMSDPDRQRLTVLDPATGAIRLVGTAGDAPGQFRLPIGLAAGPDGRLYVVDSDNRRIQVFSSLGAP